MKKQNFIRCYFILKVILVIFTVISCQENLKEFKEQAESVCEDPEKRNFELTTLGYITPWNKDGVDIALKYVNKFDIVSPCYFSIKPETFNQKFNVKVR